MIQSDSESREQRCLRYVQEAVDCFNRSYMRGFRVAVAKAVELNCSIRNLNFMKAICLGAETLPFCTLEALDEELAHFPDNAAARQALEDCTARISAKREPLDTFAGYPTISLVIAVNREWRSTIRTVRSALFQLYPKIEVIVVGIDVGVEFEAELSGVDRRVRPIRIPTGTQVEALQLGLQQARGEYQLVIPDDTCVCTLEGLRFIAEFLHAAGSIEFVYGTRMYLDNAGFPQDMRSNLPRWSRSMVLDERNFTAPTVVPRFGQMVWSKSLFERVGNRLDVSLVEAYEYELCCRFVRHVRPVSLPAAVSIGRVALDAYSDALSVGYVTEAVRILREEKKAYPLSAADDELPFRFVSPKAESADSAASTRGRSSVGLSPEIRRLVAEQGPVLSIVTPSFNQAAFLEETIDSILGQGYPRLEYIIIDGGSTDGSVEIIKKYAHHLRYWCSARDAGQYFAIQKGLSLTTGEVMAWLNSDDRYVQGALWGVAAVFLAFPHVRWLTGLHGSLTKEGVEEAGRFPEIYSRESYLMEGYDRPFIQQEGTFWRRSLWEQVGSALDVRFSLAGDFDLWRRFFRHSPLHTAEMPIGFFRQHETQRSQVYLAEYHREAHRGVQDELALIQQGHHAEMLEPCPAIKGVELERALREMLAHVQVSRQA